MFYFYVLLSLTLNFDVLIGVILKDENLVPYGSYPNHQRYDVNLPECGLRYVPTALDHLYDEVKRCVNQKLGIVRSYQRERPESRILRGTVTQWAEAPWVILLLNEEKHPDLHCTATLITFQWVITAGHCGEGWKKYNFKILAGSNVRGEGEVRYRRRWIPHPKYDHSKVNDYEATEIVTQYDMGLIKLNKPFTRHKIDGISYTINPICLPINDSAKYAPNNASTQATIFGWGDEWGYKYWSSEPENLLKGNITILPYNECRDGCYCAIFNEALNKDERLCLGDSGGPLIRYTEGFKTRAVQIGVFHGGYPAVSRRETGCTEQNAFKEGFWSSVPKNIDWILKTIKENN